MLPDIDRLQKAAEPADIPFWKGAVQGAIAGLLASLVLAVALDWLFLDGWFLDGGWGSRLRMGCLLGVASICGAWIQGGRKTLASVPRPVRSLVWHGVLTTVAAGGAVAIVEIIALGLLLWIKERETGPFWLLSGVVMLVSMLTAIPIGFIVGAADAKEQAARQFGEQGIGPKAGHGTSSSPSGHAHAMTAKQIQT
jgi:hypothetical protein